MPSVQRTLLEHHEAAGERLIGTTSPRPVAESVVKLRKSSSIQLRSAAGSTAAVKLPGAIAWHTTYTWTKAQATSVKVAPTTARRE